MTDIRLFLLFTVWKDILDTFAEPIIAELVFWDGVLEGEEVVFDGGVFKIEYFREVVVLIELIPAFTG